VSGAKKDNRRAIEGKHVEAEGFNSFGIDRATNDSMKKMLPLLIALVALPALSVRAGDAKAIYEQDCLKCHGADGKGDTKMGKKMGAKDYSDPKVQEALKDEAGIKAIKEGLKDKEGKTLMKPGEGISDDDAKALVAYMRTFKK
jgi:mono/diheme cytochrome c family protein